MTGRPPKPIAGLDQHDFDKLAKSPKLSANERVRLLALAHIKEGKGFSEVAEMLRVVPRAISIWARRFRENGIDGLRDRHGGGPKPCLPVEKHEEFRQSVIELQTNRKGGRIRGEDVKSLLKSRYGVECCLSTVYSLLKRVGLVWISGRSQHPKVDPDAQLDFKKNSKKK